MNDPIGQSLLAILILIFITVGGYFFLLKGVDVVADWMNVKGEKKEDPKEPLHKRAKKYFTVKNYLIALATLATVGIIVIAIKLL